ncbi:MAG TPA: o-succinylbenzoate synthase [Bacteroidota bacterium]|nr:o-succinylbenzoate synthase [Bacteroidota bacterium]
MSLERITLTHVRVPLVAPFRISNGEVSEKDGILVRVDAGGVSGVGEASPMAGSFYSDDTPESVWKFLSERLIPAALSAKADSVASINRLLDRTGGSPFARAGLETAYWDIEAQTSGKPLYEILGGFSVPVESGLAVGITKGIPELLETIEKHLADGYRRVKIMIQPGWDVGPLGEIRQRFGDIPLMADANGAYTRRDFPHLRTLDAFGLLMIEQPLPGDDLKGHAELQSSIRTPLCLDEGAADLAAVRRAIRLKSCRIVNIKIQRVGGLSAARAMHDMCARGGIPVWAGTMPELGVGRAQALHLATLPNFAYPTDVGSSARWFLDDIIEPLITVHDGKISIPGGTGICFALAQSTIERFRIAERVFTA